MDSLDVSHLNDFDFINAVLNSASSFKHAISITPGRIPFCRARLSSIIAGLRSTERSSANELYEEMIIFVIWASRGGGAQLSRFCTWRSAPTQTNSWSIPRHCQSSEIIRWHQLFYAIETAFLTMTIAIKDSAPKVPTQSPFGPSHEAAGTLPDLVLITADKVAFYTHRRRLSHASSNSFGGLLFDTSDAIHVPESGTCIDLALRIMYGFPCAQLVPALEDIVDAVAALTKYGISVQKLAAPFLSLYQLILAYAPHRSIEVYALAGHYGLEELAVAVSSHLLAYDTSMLSDELSIEMGPIYIRRLFELHAHRRNALRNIVLRLPTMHPRTNECTEDTQWQLTQAWAYAAAEIVWEALPSMSPCALQSAFEKNGTLIKCRDCREMLHNGIQEAMYEWSSVRSTI